MAGSMAPEGWRERSSQEKEEIYHNRLSTCLCCEVRSKEQAAEVS